MMDKTSAGHVVGSAATGIPWTGLALPTGAMAALGGYAGTDVTGRYGNTRERHAPDAGIAPYPPCHGIKVDAVRGRNHTTTGDAPPTLARDCAAGPILTGACGHGRQRGQAPGGGTREPPTRTPVPPRIAR
jgi:hypothetical protein